MTDAGAETGHLYDDSHYGDVCVKLDVQNRLKTKAINTREEKALEFRVKIMDRAIEITRKTHEHESKMLRNSLQDIYVKTPYFDKFWKYNTRGRPSNRASAHWRSYSRETSAYILGKLDNIVPRRGRPALATIDQVSSHTKPVVPAIVAKQPETMKTEPEKDKNNECFLTQATEKQTENKIAENENKEVLRETIEMAKEPAIKAKSAGATERKVGQVSICDNEATVLGSRVSTQHEWPISYYPLSKSMPLLSTKPVPDLDEKSLPVSRPRSHHTDMTSRLKSADKLALGASSFVCSRSVSSSGGSAELLTSECSMAEEDDQRSPEKQKTFIELPLIASEVVTRKKEYVEGLAAPQSHPELFKKKKTKKKTDNHITNLEELDPLTLRVTTKNQFHRAKTHAQNLGKIYHKRYVKPQAKEESGVKYTELPRNVILRAAFLAQINRNKTRVDDDNDKET